MPLNAGLNIKDAGVPKFSRGRDGDLRDIWRKAATGGDAGATGRLLTVLGSENVIEHKIGRGYPLRSSSSFPYHMAGHVLRSSMMLKVEGKKDC